MATLEFVRGGMVATGDASVENQPGQTVAQQNERIKAPLQRQFEVHHQKTERNLRSGRIGQLGHHPAQAKATLRLAELSFHVVANRFVGHCWFLVLGRNVLGRPTERRAAHANTVCFAIRPIAARAINLVDVHRLGIKAKPPLIPLDLLDKIGAFVVVVPAEPIDKRKSVDHADRQLGAKLRLVARLAPRESGVRVAARC